MFFLKKNSDAQTRAKNKNKKNPSIYPSAIPAIRLKWKTLNN